MRSSAPPIPSSNLNPSGTHKCSQRPWDRATVGWTNRKSQGRKVTSMKIGCMSIEAWGFVGCALLWSTAVGPVSQNVQSQANCIAGLLLIFENDPLVGPGRMSVVELEDAGEMSIPTNTLYSAWKDLLRCLCGSWVVRGTPLPTIPNKEGLLTMSVSSRSIRLYLAEREPLVVLTRGHDRGERQQPLGFDVRRRRVSFPTCCAS